MVKKIKAKGDIKGIYKITECRVCSESIEFMKKMKEKTGEEFQNLLQEFHKLFSIRQEVFENIIPNVALNAIAENLLTSSPSPENKLSITHAVLGTGTSYPVGSDTTLANEQFRTVISSKSRVNNIHYSTIFLTYSEGNGSTFSEFGLFCGNATSTPDSGTLFSRVIVSPSFEKTSAKTLTIEASHTFTSA